MIRPTLILNRPTPRPTRGPALRRLTAAAGRPRARLGMAAVGVTSALLLGSGCQAQLGSTAAYVGDYRITSEMVERNVERVVANPAYKELGVMDASSLRLAPRAAVLTVLIQTRLFEQLAAKMKVSVDQAEIPRLGTTKSARNYALQSLVPTDLAARQLVYGNALNKAFKERTVGRTAEFVLVAGKLPNQKVTVNPRYGVFDRDRLMVTPSQRAQADEAANDQQSGGQQGGQQGGGQQGANPEQGGPQQGGPEQDGPEQGGPQEGGPQQGGPEQGGPEQGGPDQGGPDQGGPQQGGPEQGGPQQGGPEQGGPQEGAPEQGGPPQDGSQPGA